MSVSKCRTGLVVAVWMFCAVGLQASSTLNFPRLSFENDTITGIAIVNPSADTAEVTITAYGDDGQLLSGTGISNPVSISIPAEEQYSGLTSELFGEGLDPGTVGWFQATSATNGLTGFFLFLNEPPFAIFDGADLPASALDILFTQVRLDAGYITELNLLNPGNASANLELELIRAGNPTLTGSLSLAPKGAARVDVANFFGAGATSDMAYVKVGSDEKIAGFELIHAPEGDLAGLNARSAEDQLTHLYFPQMAVLGDFQTQVGVLNPSDQAVILTLSAFDPNGSLYGTEDLQNNPVTRSLAPDEMLVEDLESMFGFSGEETLDGWLKVESSSESITGYLTYRLPTLGAAATVTPNRVGQTQAIFSHIATVDGLFTGVAVLNSGQAAANLLILAITPTGDILGTFSTVLSPQARLSKLITELIPEAENQPGGLIFLRSDSPVHLTSLFGTSVQSVLSNIPPQVSPDSYRPDAQLQPLEVTPPLAVLQPDSSQVFLTEGATGSVTWLVNGMPGGETSTGTISPTGNYTAPSSVPDPRTVTISAQTGGQTAGASVDVLDKQNLLTSSSVVQSVVYLSGLEKLYTAELTLLGSLQTGPRLTELAPHQGAENSDIFEVQPGGAKTSLMSFPGEEISKMIDFRASNGQELLLLAAKTTGRVIRFDPLTQASQDVATGLDQPTSLVVDPVTGDLLVAEQSRVSQIPRAQLETGLAARKSPAIPTAGAFLELFPTDAADGIAVDRCTGDIYFSQRQNGQLLRYRRTKELLETVLAGRQDPTRMLGIHRRGVSCPDSFQLLFIEEGRDQISLFLPRRKLARFWIAAGGARDVAFLPRETPFSARETVLLAEEQVDGSAVSGVDIEELYDEETDNPSVIEDPEPEEIDLSVRKTASLNRVEAGAQLTYILTVRNAGPAAATEVRLVDALPEQVSLVGFESSQGACSESDPELGLQVSLACALGTLQKGEIATVNLEVQVNPSAVGRLVNFAAVEGREEEFDFSDNAAEEITDILSPLMIISNSVLPPGFPGIDYAYVLRAIGGERPYSWDMVSGSLPDGLLLTPDGLIFGEPGTEGNFEFTAQVLDATGETDQESFTINVLPVAEPLTIISLFLAVGIVDTPYLQPLAAIGGTPPHDWEVIDGSLPDGLMLNPDGLISGEPTSDGDFEFTVQVVDEAGETDEATFELVILPGLDSLTIITSGLPVGTVEVPYFHPIIAIGGIPPYDWEVIDGSLPDGLTLTPDGLLSGTPTTDGDFDFSVQVTDSGATEGTGESAEKSFTLTVVLATEPLAITTTSLPDGTIEAPYSRALAATGGAPPYDWSVISGLLPPDLTLDPTGLLIGTPTTDGTFNFTVQTSDGAGQTDQRSLMLTITVLPLNLTITSTSPLPGGIADQAYSELLTAAGGMPPYSWDMASGSLPDGLTLDAGGEISGAPASAGFFNPTVQVTDDVGTSAEKTFPLQIVSELNVNTGSPLPGGTVGVPYVTSVFASGGTGVQSWSLVDGSLPPGLTLSFSSFVNITGTPIQSGTFDFTLEVTDASPDVPQTDSRNFEITIDEPPILTISTDSPLPEGTVEIPYSHSIDATGGTGSYTWSLLSETVAPGLTFSQSGFSALISGTPTDAGTFSFDVEVTDNGPVAPQTVSKSFDITIDP